MKKKYKNSKYFVQIDKKFSTIDVTEIWWHDFSFIKDVEFITYWSYNYSFKSKQHELFESFEQMNDFDRIFDTIESAEKHCNKFREKFAQNFQQLQCRNNLRDIVQLNSNRQFGKSDVRYFSNNSDNWRHS